MTSRYWTQPISEICSALQSDVSQGLSSKEAEIRLEEQGPNVLPQKGKIVWWKILLGQFSSLIVWLLIGAAIVAGFLGEVVDGWAIGAIIVLNAALGFFQEYRAEHSLEALQKLDASLSKVIREGNLQTIPSQNLVPGDLVLLEAGDRVPADGRIAHTVNLSVNEASLTGESTPVAKTQKELEGDLPLGDRTNMAFRGSTVIAGKGNVLITATGIKTEMGKIASQLLIREKEKTPLQNQLNHLGKKLVYICGGVVAIVFALGVFRGSPIVEMLLVAMSLAVAAIPEGLPAAVTISLSIGVRKMAEKKALVRRLSSVETLGSTNVICSDKTGTLTQNAMTVRSLWIDQEFISVTGSGYAPEGDFDHRVEDLEWALKIGVLCNNANILQEEERWKIVGDPTEGALLTVAGKANLSKSELEKQYPLLEENPFDSERKMMSMLRSHEDKKILFAKGAPDVIVQKAKKILLNGKEIPLDEAKKNEILKANEELANQAYRVLAVSYQTNLEKPQEEDLVFVGLLGMMDPPREEVLEAIAHCREAGIQTVMVTGDHKKTAMAVAQELNMDEGKGIDGRELDAMSEEEFEKQLEEITVFSRISAEHKLRIIRAYKKKGKVTAMTGDGINDAPAVHAADIGIAMGITGTDVTKESSDMVILDDNFASIAKAVEQGRGIYDNIVKFVSYLLSSNIAEILVIFITMLLGIRGAQGEPFVALLPVQLLWINLVTDGFPAISLAMDPIDPLAMQRPPRPRTEPILNLRFSLFLFSISVLVTAGALTACFYGLKTSLAMAQTMTFTSLIVFELVRVQMIRKQYRMKLFSNRYLIVALLSSFVLQCIVLYVPSLQVVFGTLALGWVPWVVILGTAFVLWWLGHLITKLFYR